MAGGTGFALYISPNPVSEGVNSLTVRVQGTVTGAAEVTFTGATGKLLRHVALTDTDATPDVSALPAGLCLVRYTDGARTETVKVTKH